MSFLDKNEGAATLLRKPAGRLGVVSPCERTNNNKQKQHLVNKQQEQPCQHTIQNYLHHTSSHALAGPQTNPEERRADYLEPADPDPMELEKMLDNFITDELEATMEPCWMWFVATTGM